MDRPGKPIPARVGSASTFDYATTLSSDGVSIGTVEHLLSAAAGEGLDNCRIEIDGTRGPDPGRLGAAVRPAVPRRRASSARTRRCARWRSTGRSPSSAGDQSIRYTPDGDGLTITYDIDFPHPYVGKQTADLDACARRSTRRGSRRRARSGSCATSRRCGRAASRAADRSRTPSCSTTPASSRARCASATSSCGTRSSTCSGDLALLGRPLTGRIHARKAGHALHIEFARAPARPGAAAAGERSRRPTPRRARRHSPAAPAGPAAPRLESARGGEPIGPFGPLAVSLHGAACWPCRRRRGRRGEAAGHAPAGHHPRLGRLPRSSS